MTAGRRRQGGAAAGSGAAVQAGAAVAGSAAGAGLEPATLAYGRTTIPYRIERAGRRVSVAITVDAADGVVVRAPADLDRARIEALVRRKAAWIVRQSRRFEDLLPHQAEREFVSGETFWYLGRQHRLRVEAVEEGPARVALVQGRLVVRAPARGGTVAAETVREALRSWYRRRAELYLAPRLARWAAKLGVPVPPLLVREPPKRWGSCDAAGRVRINWRVMQVAPRLVDYVLAHELVHLEHRQHDAEFWARLGEVMGDAEGRRGVLRGAGVRVGW